MQMTRILAHLERLTHLHLASCHQISRHTMIRTKTIQTMRQQVRTILHRQEMQVQPDVPRHIKAVHTVHNQQAPPLASNQTQLVDPHPCLIQVRTENTKIPIIPRWNRRCRQLQRPMRLGLHPLFLRVRLCLDSLCD